jgi:hypothetical protein
MRLLAPGMVLLAMLGFSCQSDYPRIRAYYQQRGISHCLSGNCMQGIGKSDIGNGLIYEGRFEDYLPQGEGKLYQANQLVYSGKWDAGYPADKEFAMKAKDHGTKSPIVEKLGPELKDQSSPGVSKGLEFLGRNLGQAEDRRAGRVPRRY